MHQMSNTCNYILNYFLAPFIYLSLIMINKLDSYTYNTVMAISHVYILSYKTLH